MRPDGPAGVPSGYLCPECGGALWERGAARGLRFECRIGHAFEALQLWVEHCAARNTALKAAARALAENAALAWKLASWAGEQGNDAAAARLKEEAAEEERLYEQVSRMIEGLPTPREETVT
jgi:two-component system, chemotaxis family, protein-glutamate methylesterase/glutaminase